LGLGDWDSDETNTHTRINTSARAQVNFRVFTAAELQPLLDAANAAKEADEK
jgi:hypothetical protein